MDGVPGRALRYLRELHHQGALRGSLASALDDVRRFGVGDSVRYALGLAGGEATMRIRYPVGGRTFAVRATPFWKYWRDLEAGAQEVENLRFLASLVKPGQTILDVGAWEGPYTLLLADLVGPAGRVIAFEPDPRALAALRANVAANGLRHVEAEGRCLSDTEGSAPFFDSRGGTVGSLVRNELVDGFPRVSVETTTVDRYCRERGVAVDGLKVDVEGAEALVVAGAREVLAARHPWMFLEFHGVLMPEAERRASWAAITRGGREVTFVRGESRRYRAGDPVDGYPDCDYFHVVVRY